MNQTLPIGLILSAIFALVGVATIFARVDETESEKLRKHGRVFPIALLYRYKTGRYVAALLCFLMSGLIFLAHQGH